MAQTLTDKTTNTAYKTSFRKIARAAAAELRVHKKLAIITYVLYGVAFLLFIFNSYVYVWAPENDGGEMVYGPSWWGVFFALCGAAVSFFSALNVFRDMNNQQICDVSMTLPIKSSERFFSKLLCLLYIQVIPQVVSIFVGNGIRVLIGRIMYGNLQSTAEEDIVQLMLMFLAATLFVTAIATLCTCCCGAPAESAYFSIILIGIVNALPLLFVYSFVCSCAGFSYYLGDFDYIDCGWWGFLYILSSEKVILHCVVGCVISIAVTLLSGLIYVRRDAKTVGNPIASRVFFEVMLVLGCVTVFLFFVVNNVALWGLLVAAVAYVIINIIVSRAKINVFSFLKWGAKYLATAAVFTVVLVIAIATGGFGYINLRPEAKYLDGAKFNISYVDYRANSFDRETMLHTSALTPEQADEVMSICKKHIVKGRAGVNPFRIITGMLYDDDLTPVRVFADSEKTFNECPFPRSQFWENNGGRYNLDYRQRLYITEDEARAMTEELKALDYVYEVKPDIAETAQNYYN